MCLKMRGIGKQPKRFGIHFIPGKVCEVEEGPSEEKRADNERNYVKNGCNVWPKRLKESN